ncbi:MAG: PaaI family thioesterase [Pseudonocardiaceae bacterium]
MATSGVPPQVDPVTGELMARWVDEQLTDRMGIKITEWDPERMVGTMPVAHNRQPFGLLHGGASAVLAETLGSMAGWLWATPNRVPLGMELSCSHHRAATEGEVTGVCTPLYRGRTVATFEIRISDEQDRPICTARLTCLLRDRPPDDLPAATAPQHPGPAGSLRCP